MRREKPSSVSSSSRAAARRSCVGKAHACSAGSPKRSIRRFRTANAERSETCWAVIDVTSVSYGSGLSGGRRPRSGRTTLGEDRVVLRERVERLELEGKPEQRANDGLGRLVERLDVDAAGRGLDPDLAPADDAMDSALVPEVREVGPERAVARGREREVVRLGDCDGRQRRGTNGRTAETAMRPSRLRAIAAT